MSDFKRAGTADEEEAESHDEHMDERLAHLERRAESAGLSVLRESRKDGRAGRITGFGEQSRSEWDACTESPRVSLRLGRLDCMAAVAAR